MIYINTSDNKARYVLGERGHKTLVIFGINPSTADDKKLDPTVTRVTRYAKKQGFDGWLMFNIYAQRATDPRHMAIEPNSEYLNGNIKNIERYIDKRAVVWAAWGNLITSRKYLVKCLVEINRALKGKKVYWKTIGLTQKGHPHHPLMMRYDAGFVDFDIEQYLRKLGMEDDCDHKD